MGTKKKVWFYFRGGKTVIWNLILLHTNTWVTMKKNQWRICIKEALMCKAEPIPLFVTTQDDRSPIQKGMLFYHIY